MLNFLIIIKSKHWNRRRKRVTKIINQILNKKKYFNFENKHIYNFNFILMNDLLIKKYNKKYKKNNKPTDVLTFVTSLDKKTNLQEKFCDIMISAETIFKNAKDLNINFYDHLTHIFVHSLLHVKGYNHKNKKEYLIMKNKEIKILKSLDINNPYIN